MVCTRVLITIASFHWAMRKSDTAPRHTDCYPDSPFRAGFDKHYLRWHHFGMFCRRSSELQASKLRSCQPQIAHMSPARRLLLCCDRGASVSSGARGGFKASVTALNLGFLTLAGGAMQLPFWNQLIHSFDLLLACVQYYPAGGKRDHLKVRRSTAGRRRLRPR
jgi:hypothetical protein